MEEGRELPQKDIPKIHWETEERKIIYVDPNGKIKDATNIPNIPSDVNIFDILPQKFKENLDEKYGFNRDNLKDLKEPLVVEYPYIAKDEGLKLIKWQRWSVNLTQENLYKIVGDDVTELKENQIDALTGLYGRSNGTKIINELSKKGPLTIGFIDLNKLKEINDDKIKGGHDKGDEYIKSAANLFKRYFKYIFRWGGDEFVFVLDQGEDVNGLVEELRGAADGRTEIAGRKMSFAVGFASTDEFLNYRGKNVNEEKSGGIRDPRVRLAMKSADVRMYENKMRFRNGRKEEENLSFDFSF